MCIFKLCVRGQRSCICVLRVSILLLSMIFLLIFGIVSKVWYILLFILCFSTHYLLKAYRSFNHLHFKNCICLFGTRRNVAQKIWTVSCDCSPFLFRYDFFGVDHEFFYVDMQIPWLFCTHRTTNYVPSKDSQSGVSTSK